MKRVVYVFEKYGVRTTSYAEAQKLKAKGCQYKVVHETIKEDNQGKGKYVGKPIAKYVPAYTH